MTFFAHLLTDTVVVVRPTQGVDGAGNATLDWSTPGTTTLPAFVLPAGREGTGEGVDLHGAWDVYTTAGVVVLPLDRIEWDGDTYQLVGPVRSWRSPFPGQDHTHLLIAGGDIPPFPDLVTIRRPATTRDAEYNPVATTTVVDTTPGLLAAPGPAGEGLVAGQAGLEVDTEIQVPVGTVARAGDVAVVAGRGTWRIVHVLEDRFMIRLRVTRSEP